VFSKQGMTMVETLVYVAVLVVLLLAITGMLFSMTRSYAAFVGARNLNASASIALERMTREIRAANSITAGSSVFDTSPGRLTIVGPATTTEFYIAGDTLYVRENGVDSGALTRSGVSVDSLVFRQLDSGISSGVRIELTLSAVTGTTTKTEQFSAFSVLRNSYH